VKIFEEFMLKFGLVRGSDLRARNIYLFLNFLNLFKLPMHVLAFLTNDSTSLHLSGYNSAGNYSRHNVKIRSEISN